MIGYTEAQLPMHTLSSVGLAVPLVHRGAEELLNPGQKVRAERLAARANRAVGESAGLHPRGADHPQRGRGQQRHPELAHEPDRPLGGEHAVQIDDDRQPVEPVGCQNSGLGR